MAGAIELLKRLVAIPSDFGNEREMAEFLASRLKGEVKLQKVEGAGPNVVAASTSSENGMPRILLTGHMDTVPPPKNYGRDPYKAVAKDGKLYGLGTCDMKAGLAIMAELYNEYSAKGLDVTFLGTSDEEGDCRGVFKFLESAPGFDLCLVGEPTNLRLMMGCRGRFVVEVEVFGTAAHGARPEKGVNAIRDAAEVLRALDKIKPRAHKVLGPGSSCVLKITGGGDGLSVPDYCIVRLDRHVVPGDTKESVMAEVDEALKDVDVASRLNLRWMPRPTPFLEPFVTPKGALVRKFIERVGEPEVIYGKSVGDYNALAKRYPTLVYGPSGDKWHAVGEYVDISSVGTCQKNYGDFLSELLHD